jgi:hypothetical protein
MTEKPSGGRSVGMFYTMSFTANAAFDSRPWLSLDRDYPRRKRTTPLGRKPADNHRGGDRLRFRRSDYFVLLGLRGPAGRHYRPRRHERHCKTLLLPVGVHRVQILWNGTSQLLSSMPRVAGVAVPLGAVRE